MFTVKIRFESGNENVFEARRVEWIEKAFKPEDGPEIKRGVLIHYEDGSFSRYDVASERTEGQWTHIWVMNRHGETVSHYTAT
jgi:hypothetical protein